VTDMGAMFYRASAWLASYARVYASSSNDGPPNAWYRILSPSSNTTNVTSPPPPPSDDFDSVYSGAQTSKVCDLLGGALLSAVSVLALV